MNSTRNSKRKNSTELLAQLLGNTAKLTSMKIQFLRNYGILNDRLKGAVY